MFRVCTYSTVRGILCNTVMKIYNIFVCVHTIIIIIIYNLYRGKAPVTGSDFQGGPLRVKIKYTKAKNIQYN